MYETILIEQIIPAIRNLFPNDFNRVVPARWSPSAFRIKGTKITG